jgi:CcdB protein
MRAPPYRVNAPEQTVSLTSNAPARAYVEKLAVASAVELRQDLAAAVAGRLTPVVRIDFADCVVVIPALAGLRTRDLRRRVISLAHARGELLAAIDYLFFGI